MKKYEASKAVGTAKTITSVLSVILLVCGVLALLGGFVIDRYGVRWDIVISGAYLVGAGLVTLIIKGALTGLEAVTYASEIYIENNEKKEDNSIDNALKCMEKIKANQQ